MPVAKKKLKKQVGGVNSYKLTCGDVRNHHKNIRVRNLDIHKIKQEDIDKAKETGADITMTDKSVVVIPFSLVFDKRYKDPVTNATESSKGLVTDMNSFAMYASHDLFMSYWFKMSTCQVVQNNRKGINLINMVNMYISKRNAYIQELTDNYYINNSTAEYNFRNMVNGLGRLNDFREVVMRPYRIIKHKIDEYNTRQNRPANKKSYFVFKGGLSLKYMLESLLADMQCSLVKRDNTPPRPGRRCNEDRQKIFNKINVAVHVDTNFQFHDLTTSYIGQDAEKPYFKASDFDTGIYINKANFVIDYKVISKIATTILVDQKDFFDSVWLYNLKKTPDLLNNSLLINQYWNELRTIRHNGTYSYNNTNIFDTAIENGEGPNSVEAKNRYYKMCTDLFLDRIRIISYLVELVPILYNINDYDKDDNMKRQKNVKKSHVKFLELFDFHEIYKKTEKQLFNDVNLDFHTDVTRINKNDTQLISPLSEIPMGFRKSGETPNHPLQNILYQKYKERLGDRVKMRGIPEKRETSKLVYNTSEFIEQCFQKDDTEEVSSFFNKITKKANKTPYYISNNDSINITRLSETNKQNLIQKFGENTRNWPTGDTSFGLIRSKLNYKLLMKYSFMKNNLRTQATYEKNTPGEMIDISIPRPTDIDIASFYGEVSGTNRQNGSYVNYIDLHNYRILDTGTVERTQEHGVLEYVVTWLNGGPGIPHVLNSTSIHGPHDEHIMGLYQDIDSHTAKYKYVTSINGINTLNLNYIIKDTIQMLAFHNPCPWSDPKYEKRLYRVFVVILFKYILENATSTTKPTLTSWKKYLKNKLRPIYTKLDLGGVRSCAGILYQEEDEILNKLEEKVVKKWKAIYKRKKKIGENKIGHDDWKNITRTYNLRIYIRNLLNKIGEEYNTYEQNSNTTEIEFNTLIYKITDEWATAVGKNWSKDKDPNKPKHLDMFIIKSYMFFALDNTNKLWEKDIIGKRNDRNFRPRKRYFYPRNRLIGLLRMSETEVNNIQPTSEMQRAKEVRLLYSKIREYFSKYKSYEKVCDDNGMYATQSKRFRNNLDDICIELYNKYIKNPDIENIIRDMDVPSARFIKDKYFSNNSDPSEEIKTYRGGKKLRKHRGIHQIGGNKGRLKKGYKYSGKKLKSGLSEIISVKSKRSKTNRK